MKMKEICARSGLTERAVRLYCDRGLVHPEKHWERGREYLEFSDHNLRELAVVSRLRHADFTLDEISLMLASPEQCGDVLAGWRGRITEQNQRLENAKDKLAEISAHDTINAEHIAELLGARVTAHGAAPYEGETFAEFCERQDHAPAYSEEMQKISLKEERRERLGRLFLILYTVIMSVISLIDLALAYASTGSILPGLIGIAVFVLLTVFLFRGATWARVVIIVRHVLAAFVGAMQMPKYFPDTYLYTETITAMDGTTQTIVHTMPIAQGILITALLLGALLLDLLCVYMLWFDCGVKDYLYERSLEY